MNGITATHIGEFRGVNIFINKYGVFEADGKGVSETSTSLQALRKKITVADPDRTDLPGPGIAVVFRHNWNRWRAGKTTGRRRLMNTAKCVPLREGAEIGTKEPFRGVAHIEVKLFKTLNPGVSLPNGDFSYWVPHTELFSYDSSAWAEMLSLKKEIKTRTGRSVAIIKGFKPLRPDQYQAVLDGESHE